MVSDRYQGGIGLKKRVSVLIGICMMALLLAACGGGSSADGEITIKFSHVVAPDTPKGKAADIVEEAGGKACPPLVVGVGVGGNFDRVTTLAKQAILRQVGVHHHEPHLAALERDLLDTINRTGIGPQGLGGTQTALWVAVESFPCHIASLPVAVNLQCHAARQRSGVI